MASTSNQHSGVLERDLMRLEPDFKRDVNITTFNEKVYVHIRVFITSMTEAGRMIPMLTGVALIVNQWRNLLAYAGMIDNQWITLKANGPDKFAPVRLTNNSYEPEHFIYVSRWYGVIKLHIRIYASHPTTDKMIPTVKRITLSEEEWSVLKTIALDMGWNITEAMMKLNNARTLQMQKWNLLWKDSGHRARN